MNEIKFFSFFLIGNHEHEEFVYAILENITICLLTVALTAYQSQYESTALVLSSWWVRMRRSNLHMVAVAEAGTMF